MGVVFAAPYAAPVPSGYLGWRGITHTWTGWDGSVWDLSDPRSGVALVSEGLEGLGMPEIVNHTHGSPVVHGLAWDGWLATGRKVYWSVIVYSGKPTDAQPSSEAWLARERAFWKTMRPGTTGVWTVELPTGEKFSLTLRFNNDGGHSFNRDPVQRGWEIYGIELFPEQPFWEEPPVIQSWATGEQVDWYGPDGFGPDFFVSPSSQIATATLTNPGDVESSVLWTVYGPSLSAAVGIGGDTTPIPFPIPDGSKLVLDTNPRNLIAELDGVDVMDQLGEFNYSELPPGENVQLSLSMDGTGAIEARFVPYRLRGL